MNVIVLTPPPFEPLSLAEAYDHLHLDPEGSPANHPEDAWLVSAIKSARGFAESHTHSSLVQRTMRLVTAGWTRLELLRGPVQEVLAVSYYDSANAIQTLDPASYYVTEDHVPQVRLLSGAAGPALYDRPDAVRVDYIAGYAPAGSPAATQEDYAGNVPDLIKSALKLYVGDLYENRMTGSAANPADPNGPVAALLADFVIPVLA